MIATRLVADDATPPAGGTPTETITLPSSALLKRIQRVLTDSGEEVGIRLPPGSPALRHGDRLDLGDGRVAVIQVEQTPVVVVRARSILEMARAAHTLGNRHIQAQFFDAASEFGEEVMVVPDDHTVVAWLESAGVPHTRERRVLEVPFRHAEHTH